MTGFPKLIPAFTARLAVDTPTPISQTLTFVSIVPGTSTLVSEPSYPLQIDAKLEHGSDYIKAAADGGHVRLDVQSMLRDARSGGLLRLSYRGKIAMGGEAGRVLRGEEGAGTTQFGESFIVVEFEAGGKELAVLEEKVYVGAGRFIIEPGKPVVVEYKISEVSA